jgi:cytochrome P450
MAYAVTLLAAYPEWQNWIAEELDLVLCDAGKTEAVEYGETYSKLTRCLALMLETLRLYPAVVHLSRSVDRPQTIKTATHTYEIPGPAKVYVNTPTLHSEPSVWGPNSLEFKPTRWLVSETPKTAEEPEQLVTPARGTFLPWSAGPRACPGQKMSQVEFVAVIATLFRDCKVEPVLLDGESREQARQRLLDIMQDSQPRLTLQMNRPQDIKLRWVTRR